MNRTRRSSAFALLIFSVSLLVPPVGFSDGGADHQVVHPRPIPLGVSGGNVNDISSLYCCSGTLGALVQDSSGTQYILSNNHVMGRSNEAVVGDPVNQPGMIDQNCQINGDVAHFTALVPMQFSKGRRIKWNQADAAIAEVIPGQVSPDGTILDIGPVSGATLAAVPGMAVQKSGRTTGHTQGTVLAVDVTSSVGYSQECGGASNRIAYFDQQIRIGNADFSTSGDSGSLIVESGTVDSTNGLPRAVGLLFAGDSTSTLANPIGLVLDAFGVSMVEGGPIQQGPTGTVLGNVTDADTGGPVSGATIQVGALMTSTDGSGAYVLDNVPVGTVTVDVFAIGYASASEGGVSVLENQSTVVDFVLAPNPLPTIVSPDCITYDTSGGKRKDRNLLVSIKVVDDFGNAVANAAVDISVTRDGSAYANGSGATTDSNGVVTYQSRNAPNGSYETTVTDIRAAGLTFSGAASTPGNSFTKGTDSVPAQFCNATSSGNVSATGAATLSHARAAKARNAARLSALDGVVGHGVGIGANGNPVIEVYVQNGTGAAARNAVPRTVDGVPVRIVSTDGFVAY